MILCLHSELCTGGRKSALGPTLAAFAILLAAVPAFAQQGDMPPVKPEFKKDPLALRAKYSKPIPGFSQSFTPPPGFPVPIYNSNPVSANYETTTSGKTPVMTGTILTQDPAATTAGWYRSYLSGNGWTPKNMPLSQQRTGEMYVMGATKGSIDLTVTCVKPKKGNFTIINITAITMPPVAPPKH
jgi:hypothetical protein